jgi:hypothetical protein
LGDSVYAREIAYRNKRYISLVNLIPFANEISVDGQRISLAPFEMATIVKPPGETKYERRACEEHKKWVESRVAGFEKLYAELKALDSRAAPPLYANLARYARQLMQAGRYCEADRELGWGLVNELRLRKDILRRPEMKAPKLSAAPAMNGSLDAWPKEASDIEAEGGEFLAGHIFFPNSWTGPQDLSARLRLGHDDQKLYIAAEIRDDVLTDKDGCTLKFSKTGYQNWRDAQVTLDFSWGVSPPKGHEPVSGKQGAFSYTCRRTPAGYVVEGAVPLAELGVGPGGAIGFMLSASDGDNTPNLSQHTWARKQELLVPNQPNFTYWEDARNCGKLVLE